MARPLACALLSPLALRLARRVLWIPVRVPIGFNTDSIRWRTLAVLPAFFGRGRALPGTSIVRPAVCLFRATARFITTGGGVLLTLRVRADWAASRFAPLRRGPNFPASVAPLPFGRALRATGTAVFGLRPQSFFSATRGQPSSKGARAAYGVTACGTAASRRNPLRPAPFGRPATGVAPARRRPARTRPLRVRCAPFPRAVLLRTADNIVRGVSKKKPLRCRFPLPTSAKPTFFQTLTTERCCRTTPATRGASGFGLPLRHCRIVRV